MPITTAAALATALVGDNRTVVGSADPANIANGFAATDVAPDGALYGLATAKDEGVNAAYRGAIAPGGDLKVVVPHGTGDLTKNYLRTQWFNTGIYDSTLPGFGAKRCFVNAQGQPLAANGTPAASVDAAVNAETTNLTAVGEAVWNGAQTVIYDSARRAPAPGTYETSVRASSLYAPFAGWTVQNDI